MTGTVILQSVSDEPHVAVVMARLLRSRGWTAEELARRSGLSSKTVSRLLNGRTGEPKRATVSALAVALGVDETVLVGRRPEMPESQLDRIERMLEELLGAAAPTRPEGAAPEGELGRRLGEPSTSARNQQRRGSQLGPGDPERRVA